MLSTIRWISPVNSELYFRDFVRWNSDHPDIQLGIVFSHDEWPEIEDWGTPGFHRLDLDGTRSVIGWPAEGRADELTALLADLRRQ